MGYCKVGCQCRRHLGLRPPLSDEALRRVGAAARGRIWSDESRKRAGDVSRGLRRSPETRRRMSEAAKRRWRDPKDTEKRLLAMATSPNKAERQLAVILVPFGFSFVGTGQKVIDGKVPDFWDGQTGIIELYGDYWHRGDDPQDRIEMFKKRGYRCLVIWEHELKDSDQVKLKVTEFIR